MRVGLNLPQYQIDVAGALGPEPVVAAARAAEKAGFDSVWVSDHPFVVAPEGDRDHLEWMGARENGSTSLLPSRTSAEGRESDARSTGSGEPPVFMLSCCGRSRAARG